MSRAAVETIRRGYEAWNRGDFDALRAIYAPDVTAEAGVLWPASGIVTGVETIIDEFASIMGTFDHCELVPEEFIELGETVVVPTVWQGTLVGSQSIIRERVIAVYTLHEGRVTSISYFEHLDDAIDRAGTLSD